MFTAFAYQNGDSLQVSSMEELAEIWAQRKARVWVDLESPTEEAVRALDRIINVDDECLDDCLWGEQHPRIDEYEGYFFLVLYGARGEEDAHEFHPRKLAIFCGSRFLITIHRETLHTISQIRERCVKQPELVLGKGTDFLLYAIIDQMVDNYEHYTEKLEDRLEDLETESLDPRATSSLLEKASEFRGELSHLRRLVSSKRELLLPLAKGLYDNISKKLGQRFQHVRDHLTRSLSRIDLLREMLHAIRDNYHSTLTNRLNGIMKTLTMFATFMLPLSFLAGIYGMNVKFWPPPDQHSSFWIVLGIMLSTGVGLFFYFKRKNWL